MLCQADIC